MCVVGFRNESHRHVINSDYKAFIFPTLFYYNVSLHSSILFLSFGRSFGGNRYKAYIKAIFSITFILPDENTLLSVGSYNVCLMELRSSNCLVSIIYPPTHPSILVPLLSLPVVS